MSNLLESMHVVADPDDAYAWCHAFCQDGWLENSLKPHPENEYHLSKTEEMGLYHNAGNLSRD